VDSKLSDLCTSTSAAGKVREAAGLAIGRRRDKKPDEAVSISLGGREMIARGDQLRKRCGVEKQGGRVSKGKNRKKRSRRGMRDVVVKDELDVS